MYILYGSRSRQDARGAETWQERDAAAREAAVEIDD